MALPIGETPILTGKYAKKFQEMMDNPEKVSDEEREELKNTYKKIMDQCTFKD